MHPSREGVVLSQLEIACTFLRTSINLITKHQESTFSLQVKLLYEHISIDDFKGTS